MDGRRMTGAVVAVVMLSGAVAASHNEPARAKTFKGSFVTAYEPCTDPDTTTADGLPACTAVRSNPDCGFGPRGSGTFNAVARADVVGVAITLYGLETGCENHTLQALVDLSFTGDACVNGEPCTTATGPRTLTAGCQVIAGKCRMKADVFLVPLGLAGAGVTVLDLRIMDIDTQQIAFHSGVLIPGSQ